MLDKNATQSLGEILEGKVKPHNPNIIIRGKKIKNSELRPIIEEMRNDPKLNDTVILDFFLDLDQLIEKEKASIKDILALK